MYNPFAFLFSTKYSPYSRLINSSFIRRIADAFIVLFGKVDFFSIKRVGVFDYLTLFIAKAIAYSLEKSMDAASTNAWYFLLGIPLMGLHLAALIPRLVVSLISALLLLPIIALIHSKVYYNVTHPLEEKALKLSCENIEGTEACTLGSYLSLIKLELDDIESLEIKKSKTELVPQKLLSMVMSAPTTNAMLTLCFRYDQSHVSWGKWLFNKVLWMVGQYIGEFKIVLDPNDLSEDNRVALGALLKLNFAKVSEAVAEQNIIAKESVDDLILSC